MSCNEISWWSAFRGVCPLASELDDIIIQASSGSKMDWFNPAKNDVTIDDWMVEHRQWLKQRK